MGAHTKVCRGVAQSGSAPALGAGGREFESRRPDQPSATEIRYASTHLQAIPQRYAIWQRQVKGMVFRV